MILVLQRPVTADSLLKTYKGGAHPECWGRYGDCFEVSVGQRITLAHFVTAFYTSWVFIAERCVLRVLLGARSSAAQARAVAEGAENVFAIWRVGARTASQLLMCDRYESTRCCFRAEALPGGGTRLQFGSAVAAAPAAKNGSPAMGARFRLLLRFHWMYSKLLLRAAAARALRSPGAHQRLKSA